MESHSPVDKRADSFYLENAHPSEQHFESGEPVFFGRSKHVHKKVTYITLHCPDCSDEAAGEYVPLRNDTKGDKSCPNECGYFSASGPRMERTLVSAGHIPSGNHEP